MGEHVGEAAWRVNVRDGTPSPVFTTALGAVWGLDCEQFLAMIPDGVADTVFADPPFNLGKTYGARSNDARPEEMYLEWCRRWISECVRVLKPGGALFLYNLPKWNAMFGPFLAEHGMEFRHWIAISQKVGMPIAGRLYPAHYSLLYHTKGRPATFRKARVPIVVCRHCGGEMRDYGGHRSALHPDGISLSDVWEDVAPVRHRRYQAEGRRANALSSKILDRVVEISTCPGDLVIDPFGGSGTTYAVCEARGRRWLGTDIDFAPAIAQRLIGDLALHRNADVYAAPDAGRRT